MMNFNEQDRSGVVTLSAAKGLSRWAQRCFAALSMTFPVVGVKVHYRGTTPCGRHAPCRCLAPLLSCSVDISTMRVIRFCLINIGCLQPVFYITVGYPRSHRVA